MTIGEALKLERKSRGISQKDWIAGTNLSISHYSQIEHNIHKINADDILFILRKYHIRVSDFFDKIGKKIDIDTKDKIDYLSYELTQSFYTNDLNYAKKLKSIIYKKNLPIEMKYHADLIVATLSGDIKDMSYQQKNKIIKLVFSSEEWTLNQDSLKLFGRCMELFSSEQLNLFMGSVLKRYKEIENWPSDVQERVATICINYLYNVWDKIVPYKLFQIFELIDRLPATPNFCIQKIISGYFKAQIDKDTNKQVMIKNILIISGYKNIVEKLP